MPKSYIVEVEPARPAAGDRPAAGPVYRAVIAKEGPPAGPATLYEMFTASAAKFTARPCLGARTGPGGAYAWLTYGEVDELAGAVASAMAGRGVGARARAGVYGANAPEWMVAMQACNRSAVYCVPLYDSLGENAIEYILAHAETSIVFTQAEKAPELAKALKQPAAAKFVKTVVVWGTADAAALAALGAGGAEVVTWEAFLAAGRAAPVAPTPPAPADLCTIMYTSGTTGDPKGVELTHAAVASTVASLQAFVTSVDGTGFTPDDVYLSFLPLAHIFDRATEELVLYTGGSIGFWRGDIKLLVEDIEALKPTLFAGVPRVYDRIYAGVVAKVNAGSPVSRFLYNFGFARKLHNLEAGHAHDRASPVFDKLVFSKVKARLGGRVRLVISGGAPLSRHVEDFLRVAMCCRVVQGYGLTETCAGSFIAVPDEPDHFGTVGPPQPCIETRLEAVPEMKYDPLATPPRGEVLIRGPAVFSGYHKDAARTAEVLDADGWFHTGDVGEFTATGALRIVDRKKNIFKLAQGEYVAVEKVEGAYKKSPAVEQIWVYGNSFESCLVAVVVPAAGQLRAWAAGAGKGAASLEALCADADARAHVLAEITAAGRGNGLRGFELAKAVLLEPAQFAVENELLTPTFKLKRPQLQEKYQGEIDAMYAALKK